MTYVSDKEPSGLTALTSLASDDTIIVGDTSDSSEVVKSITKANLVADLADETQTFSNKTIALGSNTVSGTLAQLNTAITDADIARTDAANTFTGVQTFSTPIAATSIATMTSTVGGAVPTPPNNTTTFLRGDGTFASPSGSGDMVLASSQTNSGLKTFLDATLGLRNVANTFTSFFTNTNTASRTYTLKDASGTLAFTSDITGTNSGTNTGDQTSIVGITGTMAQFDTAVTDGNIVYQSQALGTPSSGTLTNCGSLPVSGITSSTSTALGVGSLELGNASDTTLSRSSAGVLAVEGVAIPSISSTNTLTNKRITKRTGTTTSSATPTINTDNVDFYSLTAQAVDITSFTTNLSGTPTEGQTLWIAITGTAARAITWGTSFEASTVALPTTTVSTNRLDVGFVWNTVSSKWRCVASA